MFKKITAMSLIASLCVAGSAFGLASAAPDYDVDKPFSQRVASGAASLMMKGIASGYEAKTGLDVTQAAESPVLLQVNFHATGDMERFLDKMDQAAPFLAATEGLVWKVWSLDRDTGQANGTYLFKSRAHVDFYLSEILPQGLGQDPSIVDIRSQIYDVLEQPSRITRAVLNVS